MNPSSPRRSLSRRQAAVLVTGAALYALLFALGSQIEQTGSVSAGRTALRFACALPAALAALLLLLGRVLPACRLRPEADARPFRTGAAFLLLFACYVPMFLIQYPGSFGYDVLQQALQAAHDAYNTFHPLLHTLLLRFCVALYPLLDSFERCMAVCSLIQMLGVAWCFAMLCASLSRSCSRRAAHIALAFFALYPSHMAFASAYTKDVLFAACFALFLALCLEQMRLGRLDMPHACVMLLCGVLSCLLRNNMIYAVAAWCVLLLPLCRRLPRLAVCAALVLVLSLGAQAALVRLTHAEKGPVREMLSVPAQQLARVRVYAGDQLSDAERAQMDALFDERIDYARYDPTLADPIKDRIRSAAVLGDLPGAARLWLSLGARFPGLYLDAFLNLALPSLYPYAHYAVTSPYIEVGDCVEGLTKAWALPRIVQPRRFAGVRQWLNDHLFLTGADDIPLVRWLFNIGLVFWLLLLSALDALYTGDGRRLAVLLLPLLLWGTLLLGPVMQGRYAYPFFCILPLLLLRPRSDRA